MHHRVRVVVTMPWRWRDVTWPVGRVLWIPVEEYVKWRRIGEFLEREYVRCRHWSGREYLHAVSCNGKLIQPGVSRPKILEAYRPAALPQTPKERRGCRCKKNRTVAA